MHKQYTMFSLTAQERVEWLAEALERFKRANLKLQVKKHDFAASSVEYMGHILGRMHWVHTLEMFM
jgi:hypothetical protein